MMKPITIRMDDETLDAIDSVAERYKMTRSEVIRLSVLDRLPDATKMPVQTPEQHAEYMRRTKQMLDAQAKLNTALTKIGSNVNQIAKIANQNRSINPQHITYIGKLSTQLDKLISYVNKLSATIKF